MGQETNSPDSMAPHPQDEAQEYSLRDPEAFWSHQAAQLSWHKKPSKILTKVKKSLKSGITHDHWEWFSDGEISTCYNCVDRHVDAGNGDKTAILWDSPVTKTKQKISYNQVKSEVEVLAGVLREEGVQKGDVVIIYSKENSPFAKPQLMTYSAHDTGCSLRYAGYIETWRCACCRLWWIRSQLVSSKNRIFEACGNTYRFLWYRRNKSTNEL